MTDPAASTPAFGITATGLTVLGVATGLRPELLLAGITGALWALSYSDPLPVWRRWAITVVTSLVAGYLTPVAAELLRLNKLLPMSIVDEVALPPTAVIIAFIAYRVLGPAVIRIANKIVSLEPPK